MSWACSIIKPYPKNSDGIGSTIGLKAILINMTMAAIPVTIRRKKLVEAFNKMAVRLRA